MIAPHARTSARARRGTATTETVLVIIPLLMLVGMAPWIAHMFLDLQVARTEAARDSFDKTTTMLLMPEAMMDNHVNGELGNQFGHLTTASRRHAFAGFPEEVPASIDAILDPPGSLAITFVEGVALDLFDEGFPNRAVEGWEYVRRDGPLSTSPEQHFMTYAAQIRSPWTYLGYPMVATQDLIFEPKQMQDWRDELSGLEDSMVEELKLAE